MTLFLRVEKMLRGILPAGDIPPTGELVKNTLRVAWPSVLESFLVSLVGLIDTVMVSSLGYYAITAVGLTTQPKFIGLAFFLSLNVAVSALVARRRGEEDRESANRILMQALLITLGMTAVISTLCVVFAEPIMRLAGAQEDTHAAAASYFRIIMGGMVFNTVSMVINAAQRGAGNTKIAMRTNLVSNGVNVLLNYLLIGGNFGFPRLGVDGAAIATVMGSVFACGMSLFSLVHKDRFLVFQSFGRLRFDRKTMKSIGKIGSSTLAEQIFLRIGFLTFSIIVAHLGTVAFAAHQIGMNIISISFSFGDGLSVAAVTLVGQSLGSKRRDLAKLYGGICQRLGIAFAALLAVIFVTGGRWIFRLFSDEEAILNFGASLMPLVAVVVFLQISQVIYSGCLRGAGDTVYTMLVSLISVAVIRPLAGFVFCYPLGWGLIGAWVGLAVDQLMRFSLTWLRFRSGRWMNIRI